MFLKKRCCAKSAPCNGYLSNMIQYISRVYVAVAIMLKCADCRAERGKLIAGVIGLVDFVVLMLLEIM